MSKITDSTMTKTVALPAAGASANTDSVNLKTGLAAGPMSNLEVHFELPALPNLVEDKTVIVNLQDSDDNSTFADLNGGATLTVTGGSGNGAEKDQVRFFLPPDCRPYVRAKVTVLAAGGDNTASELALKFKI